MDHIKCYENFSTPEEIKTQIESVLENIDINLNIEDWKFSPNSKDRILSIGLDKYMSIIEINLTQNNSVREILEELKWIILGIKGIEGVKSTYLNIRTNIIKNADESRFTTLSNEYGPNFSIKSINDPDYISQLDSLETPDKWGRTYWVVTIDIHVLYDTIGNINI